MFRVADLIYVSKTFHARSRRVEHASKAFGARSRHASARFIASVAWPKRV